MKVIKDKVWWVFTCKACGVKCQAEPTDVTDRPNLDHEGDEIGRIVVVECGKCGKERDVPARLLTHKLEVIARDKRNK